ncbi:hypothetical protein BU26DRAFT_69009 [Trematosphaeria pertusa]|uniref:Uncharacterized protein n=1 Tax=Trematosphaeria pertusa TaxID=390896 RepID=A0A6A6I5Z4_9PLEO|nr:uncharacterized protein BU26DRAFT_69009 [Trematosphaeria pertusa]KAF2245468.1 hypothetical protein BU26DRAFT_69009 [Trematosphaeria pertusa]
MQAHRKDPKQDDEFPRALVKANRRLRTDRSPARIAPEITADTPSSNSDWLAVIGPHNLITPIPPYGRTGSIPLFDIIPREIRDEIYFYIVHRPKGLVYRRDHCRAMGYNGTYRTHHYTWQSGNSDILFLLLTCRQLYEEALEVFCRCNTIHVERRTDRPLEGTLRLFPDKAARWLQSIELGYVDSNTNRDDEWRLPRPGFAFERMTKDAWLAKDFFPRLKVYTALWNSDPYHFHEAEDLNIEGRSEEQTVEMWLVWMKLHCERMKRVPPPWLKITFPLTDGSYGKREHRMRRHQAAWDQAMARFREVRVQERTDFEAELEESGKKWLEETWGDARRQTKKEKKGTVTQGGSRSAG